MLKDYLWIDQNRYPYFWLRFQIYTLLKHHVHGPHGPIGWRKNVKLNSNVVIGKGTKVKSTKQCKHSKVKYTKKWKIFCTFFFVLLIN